MSGDSEPSSKNAPLEVTFMPTGPVHEIKKNWASNLEGAVKIRRFLLVSIFIRKQIQ